MQVQQISSKQSISLVQNLLSACIGSISYIRMLFPEESFSTKGLQGIAVKTIKSNISVEANTVLEWIEKGCFDALEKQYLKSVVFGIYLDPNNPADLVEQYEFAFDYHNDSINVGLTSNEISITDVQKNTRNLVRRLLVMTQNLEPLPENAYITMRLYYHDHTPIDYEPPLFEKGDAVKPIENSNELNIGTVETEHHKMNLKVSTMSKNLESEAEIQSQIVGLQPETDKGNPARDSPMEPVSQAVGEPSQSAQFSSPMTSPILSQRQGETLSQRHGFMPSPPKDIFSLPMDEQIPTPEAEFTLPTQPTQPVAESQPATFREDRIVVDKVTCPCGRETENFDLIECSKCLSWNHLVCYGYEDAQDPRLDEEDFECYSCRSIRHQMISLPEFVKLCFQRRVLHTLKLIPFTTQKQLMIDAELDRNEAIKWAIHQGYLVSGRGKAKGVYLSDQDYKSWMDPRLNYLKPKVVKISKVMHDIAVL